MKSQSLRTTALEQKVPGFIQNVYSPTLMLYWSQRFILGTQPNIKEVETTPWSKLSIRFFMILLSQEIDFP